MVISRILCPIDFSDTSRRALDHAAAIAHWFHASLTVLHVFPNMPVMDVPPLTLGEAGRASVAADIERFTAAVPPDVTTTTLIVEAPEIHREIQTQSQTLEIDLLVMGTHGRSGFRRFVLGSVTERALREAPCPVLVVPPHAGDPVPSGPIRIRHIVCAVDFSAASERAVSYALAFVRETGAEVTLLHAIEIPPELLERGVSSATDIDALHAAEAARCLRRLRALIPDGAPMPHVHTDVREGAADHVILSVAAEQAADLIVAGVRGRGALDMAIFGSTTGRITRAATSPVLVVHAPNA